MPTDNAFNAGEVADCIETAAARIAPWIRHTPLERSPFLSGDGGAEVFLKLENYQLTQSFKARGAFNALLALGAEDRARGVVTSSTGNHANAMAHAMGVLGIAGEIWVPATISAAKRAQLDARGAKLRLVEGDPGEVEVMARAEAGRSGRVYVSPYNDPQVVAGQGTIAREILADLADCDDILVPVGGGGLISGIAAWVRAREPRVRITGVLPANSPVISESVRAGRLLDIPWTESLSDATVGWAEPGSITFPMCRDWVDDWLLVSEAQIRSAIRTMVGMHSMLVEGAGALATAAFCANAARFAGRRVALVVSGARIPGYTLAKILATDD
jgi:threonine dehydratase